MISPHNSRYARLQSVRSRTDYQRIRGRTGYELGDELFMFGDPIVFIFPEWDFLSQS